MVSFLSTSSKYSISEKVNFALCWGLIIKESNKTLPFGLKNTPKIAAHSGSEKILISWAIKFYKNLVAFYPQIDIIDLVFNLELTNFVFTKKFWKFRNTIKIYYTN